MFKFLRSQAKVFYWVIAATFILFLFLGGLTGRGCQAPGSRKYEEGVIGSVNGTKISGRYYEETYRQILAQMRQQSPNREMNANQYAQARQRAWDEVVTSVLVDQAIDRRGITVSDEDVLDVFTNNPPPAILARYRDEEGNLNMDQYYADLQNPDVDWSYYEAYVRQLLPRQRLEEQVTAEAVVTEEEVRAEYIRQTGKAVAEYMGVLYADLDDEFTPDEADIQTYYDAHPDEFDRPARATCKVVRFKKEPSEADYADVKSFIEEIRQEIVSGQKDFATAAQDYSEDGSAASGGDLGTFDRNRMVAPFTEAAFSLPVGEISQPVKTKFGYHLIEVLEQEKDEETGEVTQVHARHILLKVTPGMDTLTNLSEAADDFRTRVKASTFASTAEAEAMDLMTPAPFTEGRDIPGLPLSLAGSHWAFAAKKGQISPVFENRDYMYVLLAGGTTPPGPAPLDDVRGQVELALQREHNTSVARERLAPAVGDVQMGRSLAEAAAAADLMHAVTDTFTYNGNVPDVGYGTEFNAKAIEGTVGEVIPEVETLRGLFALVPLWIKPFDQVDYDIRKEGIRTALLARKRNEIISQWLDDQRAAAEIVDLRHELRQMG